MSLLGHRRTVIDGLLPCILCVSKRSVLFLIYRVYQKTSNPRKNLNPLNLRNPYQTRFLYKWDCKLLRFYPSKAFCRNLDFFGLFCKIIGNDWTFLKEEIDARVNNLLKNKYLSSCSQISAMSSLL